MLQCPGNPPETLMRGTLARDERAQILRIRLCNRSRRGQVFRCARHDRGGM